MLTSYIPASAAAANPAAVGRLSSVARSGPPGGAFAGMLSDAAGTESAPATAPGAGSDAGPDESEEIAKLREERSAYLAKREAEIRSRPQEPYPAIQVAIPVNAAGYQPFVTADQLKLIDSITDRYIGAREEDFEKMMDELHAAGVGPDQLVKTAKHFINADGEIVTRAEAERRAAKAGGGGTVWQASEV